MFNQAGGAPRVTVSDDTCYSGFDNYLRVIEKSDVVLLATTPHFRPQHLRAAVEAGKHVFCEKPVAVDAPGVRSVMESSEMAKAKGLALVSGLCWRYHPGKLATFAQIKNGAIGEIVSMQCSYLTGGVWDPRRTRDKCDSEMGYQIRNWYYYTWLSGDFNVEQHVHNLDACAWAMGNQYPVKAIGLGGQQVRRAPGNIFDHHSVVYEYADGTRLVSNCRQIPGCKGDIGVDIIGSTGTLWLTQKEGGVRITGAQPWEFGRAFTNPYQVEHDELFRSIRDSRPINNGETLAKSTLLAIMGRWATYTGQEITWDMAWNSKEDLTPPAYEFGPLPMPPVATPGVTKYV